MNKEFMLGYMRVGNIGGMNMTIQMNIMKIHMNMTITYMMSKVERIKYVC